FKTLELNVTFYRFPQLSFLQNWHAVSPPDFRFSVKAPRAITHYKQFHNSAKLITSFYDTISQGLAEKLGPVLFQMPPRFTYTEEKLDRIISNLNPSFSNVVEFRHPSWWQESVYHKLAEHRVTFCGMSHPELPTDIIQNTPLVYYRFHGIPQLYYTLYDKTSLQQAVNTLSDNHNATEAWLYFNNDIEAHAPQNAREMIAMTNH
ncbi:MAG TPA: DUF72 domain-containing protein, partial [Mucilaginibacter sp.]